MSISRLWIPIAFMMAVSASAIAKEELPPIKVHHEAGVDYVYGGMDPLEHKALAKIAERYQVQLAFSQEGTNAKLSGVKVTMIDYKGDKALEKVIDGPIFFATPPAGRWTLKAEYARRDVQQDGGRQRAFLHLAERAVQGWPAGKLSSPRACRAAAKRLSEN